MIMIQQELMNIASLAKAATAQGEKCLAMLDEWHTEQEESKRRVSAALDDALEVLNQIK